MISAGKPYVLPRMAKTLGLAMLDFDADGWMDVFVANDTVPNLLFRNKGDGTFTDVAMPAGVAVTENGVARAPAWAWTPPTMTAPAGRAS